MIPPAGRIRTDAAPGPTCVGVLFRLHAQRCGRPVEAVCTLWALDPGLELRLDVAGSLQRCAACASQDEALDTADAWKSALVDREWR
jgi:hypothetical protein